MLVEIYKVLWYATEGSDPMKYYFRDDANIESIFGTWYPPLPESTYTKEIIKVESDSSEYKMCLDG